jgi:Fe-S cluster biogenesis protein NfuA
MTERKKKIEYVKPEILDLGPVAAAHGGQCTIGSLNETGNCVSGGIANYGDCSGNGSSATAGHCLDGTIAGAT